MSSNVTNILFAAGGTGGHLFPALAIANEIRKKNPNVVFLFAGTKGKIEARIVPQHGFAFVPIWISGFYRSLNFRNLLFPFKIVVSLVQSFFLIQRFQPDVVIGTGGYVCGPVLFVASLLGIPTVIHESNSYPGVTTRMLAGRAAKVFTAFGVTNRWLKRTDNVELVGTPTREFFTGDSKESAIRFFGLQEGKRTVLVFGGSQGASSVNRALMDIVEPLSHLSIQFIWQTGERDYTEVSRRVQSKNIGWIGPFIDRMDYAYGVADIVVSRSGATTIAELTRIGKPAVLIPYPYSAADHQTINAKTVAQMGAAVVVKDTEVQTMLGTTLQELLNDSSKMASMSKLSKAMGKPDAGRIIAEKVLSLAAH